jgi:hypothetical protein
VAGFGWGAYSEKLLPGTRHRFSGFNQPRQCEEDALRIFVMGGPPNFCGGGIPRRINIISRKESSLRTTGVRGIEVAHRSLYCGPFGIARAA